MWNNVTGLEGEDDYEYDAEDEKCKFDKEKVGGTNRNPTKSAFLNNIKNTARRFVPLSGTASRYK